MINEDTKKLLVECNAGAKMGVSSLNEVLKSVKNKTMKNLLIECKEGHETLTNELHKILNEYNDSDKEPSPVAKSMSWIKTNLQLAVNNSDKTIAGLITDGCNMGIKALNRYLNQYEMAEEKVKNIAKCLISLEEKLATDLEKFL